MYIAGKEAKVKHVGSMKIKEYKMTSQFSGALIEIDGTHGKLKCLKEDRIYYIVDGEGEFSVEDESFTVTEEDVVFIPMNTIYDFSGKMKFFLICSPEFKPEDDAYLD